MTPIEFMRIRKAVGKTQAQMAAALKVSRKTIVNWEREIFQIPNDIALQMAEQGLAPTALPKEKPKPYHTDFYGLYVLRREHLNEDHATAWHVCCTDCKLYDRPLPTQEDIAAIIERYPDIINGESK